MPRRVIAGFLSALAGAWGGSGGPALTEADKAELVEVLRLQATLGNQVWPGFAAARIPVILYDDENEFIVGAGPLPLPWSPVEGDDFQGRPYHRRKAARPQAFAVRVATSGPAA
jgi:hypothetical protein